MLFFNKIIVTGSRLLVCCAFMGGLVVGTPGKASDGEEVLENESQNSDRASRIRHDYVRQGRDGIWAYYISENRFIVERNQPSPPQRLSFVTDYPSYFSRPRYKEFQALANKGLEEIKRRPHSLIKYEAL